jgi:hypothetical protein
MQQITNTPTQAAYYMETNKATGVHHVGSIKDHPRGASH